MPEITIKYKNPKTLEVLKDISKYFDFIVSVSKTSKKVKNEEINGVEIIPYNNNIDAQALEAVFSNKNIDSKSLRISAWQRKK